ncbi:MAG: hypothetical protein ACLGXA_07240 [Acidobacteriota bacterium]
MTHPVKRKDAGFSSDDEYVLKGWLYQSSLFGQVHYDSLDQVTLTFSGAFSGTASLI